MKFSVLSIPWLSMFCIGIAYGLLGWELAYLSAMWVIDVWLVTVVIVFLLMFQGKIIGCLIRLGPRSLVTIFVLSLILTLAIVYAESFGLALILLLTILLGRLELQAKGAGRRLTLTILSFMAGGFLTLGWILGRSPVVAKALQQQQQWIDTLWKKS